MDYARKVSNDVQKQAAALAEKDAAIAKLKQQLAQVAPLVPSAPDPAAPAAQSSAPTAANSPRDDGGGNPAGPEPSPRRDAGEAASMLLLHGYAGRMVDEDEDWESLPVPNSLREALEQILLLQISNSRLRDACEGMLRSQSDAPVSPKTVDVGALVNGSKPAKPPTGLTSKVRCRSWDLVWHTYCSALSARMRCSWIVTTQRICAAAQYSCACTGPAKPPPW
jgi:hypothetical protein